MAYEIPGQRISFTATADMPKRWVFVRMGTAANSFAVATAAGDLPVGVLQADGRIDQSLPVMINGVSMVEAGGAIPVGSPVIPGANGLAVVGTVANRWGIALEAAGAAGDIIPVLLRI